MSSIKYHEDNMNNDAQEEEEEGDKWYSLRMGSDPLFSPPSTFFINVDTKHKILICVYFGLFIVSHVVLNWYFSYWKDFCDFFGTPGATLISFDVMLVATTLSVWVAIDLWKMGFSIYTYIVWFIFTLINAIAITMPLYFALRVSRECKIKNYYRRPKKGEMGLESFIPFTIVIIVMLILFRVPTPFKEQSLCSN